MEQSELFSRLGVALAIGLLVGLERGWSKRGEEDHRRAAGFRTFALSGLLGGVTGLIAQQGGGVLPAAIFLAYAGAFTLFHWLEATADHDLSATSVIAGLVTFLLGYLAVTGDLALAIACAVAMTALLALREQLHRWVAALTWAEIRSTLTLLAMTFLLLPLLPNRTIDPWQAINPYEVWLMTIFVAAISFAGYVAVKAMGDTKGLLVAALAGGLASSTATTLALARIGREQPASARAVSAGILLSGMVMMGRVAAIVAVLNGSLVGAVAAPLASAACVLALAAWVLARTPAETRQAMAPPDNPLALGPTLLLGLAIAAILLATGYLNAVLGSRGVLLSAALSGVFDVDAIALSMAQMAGDRLGPDIAGQAILTAIGVNTVAKAAMAWWAGNGRVGALVGISTALALAAGAGAFVALA